MNELIELQQQAIDAYAGLLATIDPTPENQELLEQAAEELARAQDALDEAKAALARGDTTTAKTKLKESLDHTAEAIRLIKQALGE